MQEWRAVRGDVVFDMEVELDFVSGADSAAGFFLRVDGILHLIG